MQKIGELTVNSTKNVLLTKEFKSGKLNIRFVQNSNDDKILTMMQLEGTLSESEVIEVACIMESASRELRKMCKTATSRER